MPSTGRVTVGTYTREAANHSELALALRRLGCFFFGHDPAPSLRGSQLEMDGCLFCFRIIDVRAVEQGGTDA